MRKPGQLKKTRDGIGQQKRRKGLRLVQELTFLSDNFPEFASLIRYSLDAVQRETERTYHSDRERVILSIEQGAWILQDLMDDTGLPRHEVGKILLELEALGLVQKSPRRVQGTKCEYREYLYSLTHQSPVLVPPTKQPTSKALIS
jgi:predicted Rossmann fold nucleotide-binding protein DprA/Smf involved in DNA uptake